MVYTNRTPRCEFLAGYFEPKNELHTFIKTIVDQTFGDVNHMRHVLNNIQAQQLQGNTLYHLYQQADYLSVVDSAMAFVNFSKMETL